MRWKFLAAFAALTLPFAAHATDGYFSHGYGMKEKGMGGASTAVAQDAFGGANNPATMGFVGNQWAVGLDWFSPQRTAQRTGSGAANIDGSAESDSTNFFVPEFGLNYMVRPDLALGITVYGNGGMNTNYPGGQISSASACAGFNPGQPSYNLLCGTGNLGVDLMQLVIAPTAAWRFLPEHAVGVAPLFAYQRFKAEGLQAFDNSNLSTSPGSVTNNGYDDSTGWGVRIGYYGQLTPQIAIGASYSTKINMDSFDKYKGLFAQQGGFDIPSNWSLGVAFKPTPAWLIAVDYERIDYGDVKSISNPSNLLLQCTAANRSTCLGGSNGAGFGWQSINVWRFGVQYVINPEWTVRAGYQYTDNPIQPADVTPNILAPGVVQNHYTLGATWTFDKVNEITGAFMYAAKNSVTGQSLFVGFGAPASTTETITLKEYSFGLQYARKF
jgi:long-chain fatty acid transport protein